MNVVIKTAYEATAARTVDVKAKKKELTELRKQRKAVLSEENKAMRKRLSLDKKISALEVVIQKAGVSTESIVKPSVKPANQAIVKPETQVESSDGMTNTQRKAAIKALGFKHTTHTGIRVHNLVNGASKARKGVEGYWRSSISENLSGLPFPVKATAKGYSKTDFMSKLQELQKRATKRAQRGESPNRWTGSMNGGSEYKLEGWSWPSGYSTYIKGGLLPSRAFYKFVMGKDLPSLPTYNRS